MHSGSDLFTLAWLRDQARALEAWLREHPDDALRRHRDWLTAEIRRLEARAA